jgi:hypothetical protein
MPLGNVNWNPTRQGLAALVNQPEQQLLLKERKRNPNPNPRMLSKKKGSQRDTHLSHPPAHWLFDLGVDAFRLSKAKILSNYVKHAA